MTVAMKFCGLTRPEDAAMARELGAGYGGVIFAGGPREVTPARGAEVLDAAPGLRRVGVFGARAPREIAAAARAARLDVVQLHGDPSAEDVSRVRAETGCELWAVVRVPGGELPAAYDELRDAADAIVLDAKVAGRLGGTGATFDWRAVADALRARRHAARLVLAGGLHPGNVAEAIAWLAPAVVDVSSGVERAPGIKDHVRMRAFVDAVRGAVA
ncbi:MAG TPA: phosphoribosylanthranilate isomerase [Gemmatimonadaceae bacterium]|nr:phosphoribosylanthranilate isomerase [Gemmatimonadaceae bacterium]